MVLIISIITYPNPEKSLMNIRNQRDWLSALPIVNTALHS